MALDPSIALAYKPPQIDVPIPQPLQQFGQILSLRNLMQQGQLFPLELQAKQLGLQQAQLAYQRDLAMADLLQHPEKYQTPPDSGAPAATPAPTAPAAPGTFVLGQDQSGNAVHSPDGGASWVDSATGAPYSGTRYGETPVGPIGAGTGGAPYSPVSAPPAAAPVPPAVIPQAAAPAVPGGGIPGLPSWQQMIRAGGPAAFPWIKNINEARSAQLDQQKKTLDVAKEESEDMVRLGNGMTTNEFKNQNLWKAGQKGYISWDDVRKYSDMDVNDPRFQAQKDSWGQSALTYDQSVKLANDRLAEKRAENEEMRKWVEFTDTQNKESERQLREKVNAMSDPSQFASLLTTPHLQNLYGGLVGKNLDDIKLLTGAGKPGETVPKPQSVTDAEAAAAAKKTAQETTSRIAAEDAPYVGLANQFQNKQVRWDQLSPKEQEAVNRILTPPGSARTTKLSDTEATHLTNMQSGLDQVQSLRNELTGPKFLMTGKFSDIFQDLPVVGAKWDALQGRFGMLQATVGDLIKGGVLRAADQKVYQDMFPKLEDSPWTVREKLTNLQNKLTNDLGRYKESLRAQSRYIPGETPAAAPAGAGPAPAPAGPSYQTIEKTGAPGPRVTGTITIGGRGTGAVPGNVQSFLSGSENKPGTYTLKDGRKFRKNSDGSIDSL